MALTWIGDPNALGWITVVSYALAAFACYCASLCSSQRERWFWRLALLALLILGVNKQLDLQSLLTQTGRNFALSQGWYNQRRLYQLDFIIALSASLTAIIALAAFALRKSDRSAKLALAGIASLCAYVMLRAISFHHVDQLFHVRLIGLPFEWMIELGGIALTAMAAVDRTLRHRR